MTIRRIGCTVLLQLVAALSGVAWAQEARQQDRPTDADNRRFEALLGFLRNRNAQTYALTGPHHVDEASYVSIGDTDQWVTIRGEDRSNPVLLFLHGGPGDVTNPWSYPYFRGWEKYFTVVQWDQRGAGRTLGKSGESVGPTLTIERIVQDGIELTEFLRQHLGKDKIILVGHSWGSVFGALMVKARPDLFYAWVATGQVSDFKRGNRIAYELALETAQRAGDLPAVSDLKAIGPPPYSDGKGWQLLYKWRNVCEGADRFLGGLIGLALAAPGYSVRDINDWSDGQVLAGKQLFDQGSNLDPRRLGGRFAVPVFVFQGEHDCTSPTKLARDYIASITAPRKAFVAIPGAGHFAVFTRSDEFLNELVARVRPIAK